MKFLWPILGVTAAVAVIGFTRGDGERELQVIGGRSTISFFPSLLQSSGLKLSLKSTAEGDPETGEQSHGFSFGKTDLKFTLNNGQFVRYDGGALTHRGGFTLSSRQGTLNANRFTILPNRTTGDTLEFRIGNVAAFELQNARTYFDVKNSMLGVAFMDIVLSESGAQMLGQPELTGSLIGTMSVHGDAEPIDGGGQIEVDSPRGGNAPESAPNDVALSAMSSLTSVGRLGTFPNGRNGLSMSTTSCNVGSTNIDWFAPMNVRHPVIALNLYRMSNGRFEQVGWSWLKHGFLSTNSNGCGTCQSPGTGTLLGVNCSDTYGTGNNSDRNYLGGRDEVNPFTGVWTCQNSYFSNYINDCVRRNNGSEFGSDPVAHRLEVRDADLGNAGAQYFYEAYYISANDFDRYNNLGSRTATMVWNSTLNRWDFTTTTTMVTGPAINRYGEMRNTAQPTTDGDVIVAVQTTNLGGGMHRYEYAVYNHTLDRQVREFSVPLPTGATVANIGFRDIDQSGTNEWAAVVGGNKITWSTGIFGSSTANPLKYSSVFNFRFDCNVAPVNGNATLGLFKPGTGTTLAAASKTPMVLQPVSSFSLVNSAQFSGNLASLADSDNNSLEVGPTAEGSRSGSGIATSMTLPAGTVNVLTIGVESRNTLSPTTPASQTIQVWDWTTGDWALVDRRPAGQTDVSSIVAINSNVARFVNGTTREVRLRIMHTSPLGETGNRWKMFLDQVGVHFN